MVFPICSPHHLSLDDVLMRTASQPKVTPLTQRESVLSKLEKYIHASALIFNRVTYVRLYSNVGVAE